MTMTGQTGSEESLKSRRGNCARTFRSPHMHHLVVYFTSHQARGSRPNRLQVGVYTALVQSRVSISLSLPYARPRTLHAPPSAVIATGIGDRDTRPVDAARMQHAAPMYLANARLATLTQRGRRLPRRQRRTSFLSHSALSAVSLATASAFSLAVSSARSASSRPTAAACVCAARTAHDWTKA